MALSKTIKIVLTLNPPAMFMFIIFSERHTNSLLSQIIEFKRERNSYF